MSPRRKRTKTKKDIPLFDLHRHLDGAVRFETIFEYAQKHNLLPVETKAEFSDYVYVKEPVENILEFFKRFKWQTLPMDSFEMIQRIASEAVEDAHFEGIQYLELRFSPLFMAKAHNLDPHMITEAVITGVEEATKIYEIDVNLIGIVSRTYGAEEGMLEMNAILSQRGKIAGVDLAGDESNFPANLFIPHFKKAQNAGLRVTVHAGEVAGPESIWSAIKDLGAERIGHAITVFEDPKLVDYMVKNEIGIEVNLSSNYQTKVVENYEDHPLKNMLNAGLLASINTDDPGISHIDLPYELSIAARAAGLTQKEIYRAQENAIKTAFMTYPQRKKYA